MLEDMEDIENVEPIPSPRLVEPEQAELIILPFLVDDHDLIDRVFDYLDAILECKKYKNYGKQHDTISTSSLAWAITNISLSNLPERKLSEWLPHENSMLALCRLLHFFEYLDVPMELFISLRFHLISILCANITNCRKHIKKIEYGTEETLLSIKPAIFNLAMQHIPMYDLERVVQMYKTLVKKYQPQLVLVLPKTEYSNIESALSHFYHQATRITKYYHHLKNDRPLHIFSELWVTKEFYSKAAFALLTLFPHVDVVMAELAPPIHSIQNTTQNIKENMKEPYKSQTEMIQLCTVETQYDSYVTRLQVKRKEFEIQLLRNQLRLGVLGSDTPLTFHYFQSSTSYLADKTSYCCCWRLSLTRIYNVLVYRKKHLPFLTPLCAQHTAAGQLSDTVFTISIHPKTSAEYTLATSKRLFIILGMSFTFRLETRYEYMELKKTMDDSWIKQFDALCDS